MDEKVIRIDRLSIFGMKTHASLRYPDECCGLMFGQRTENKTVKIQECVPLNNMEDSLQSKRHFTVSPMSVWSVEKAAGKRGMEIIGIYNSHPNTGAYLSKEDEEKMIPGQIYAVVSVGNEGCRELRMWEKASADAGIVEHRYEGAL